MVHRDEIELDAVIQWIHSDQAASLQLLSTWKHFLDVHPSALQSIQKIDLTQTVPILTDHEGRKLSIDFINNAQNYNKKKGSLKTELISKALGAGRLGFSVLDLSAGLGIDSVFLSQLGYDVTAIERNPILFLALDTAQKHLSEQQKQHLRFKFASAKEFLMTSEEKFDVIYFDPMFPEKKKSALPRQEMVMFRHLVGSDDDAKDVIETAIRLKKAKRVVVKRPIKAPLLLDRPQNQVEGKLIRFDVYGVQP